jgi:hypothetical protein
MITNAIQRASMAAKSSRIRVRERRAHGWLPVLLAVCTSSLVFSASAQAPAPQLHDLAAEWSDAANPNGAWTYREGNNALPSVVWTQAGYPQPAWAPSNVPGNYLPACFKATQLVAGLDWKLGDVVVHTTDSVNGPNSGVANLIWTSPYTTSVTLSGSIWMCRDIGRSVGWSLLVNGAVLTSGDVSSGDPYSSSAPFFFDAGSAGPLPLQGIAVNPGDVIQLVLKTTRSFGDFVDIHWTIAQNNPAGTWTNLGFGLAGTNGLPTLAGTGSLVALSPGSLVLAQARPSSLALLFISFASMPISFKGGTLVPVPVALTVSVGTNAGGGLTLPFLWPSGLPSATSIYFQDAIQDPAAIKGVALSNALRAVTP